MVVIEVSNQYWTKIKDNLTNKNTFEFEIYNLLINQQKIPENSKIVLPVSVSTADRHKMHILTRAGFEPKSKGENDRYMELFIKKEYFAILHNRFKIEEIEEPVVQPIVQTNLNNVSSLIPFDAFKKAILDDIMGIVEKHLNSEFLKYYV